MSDANVIAPETVLDVVEVPTESTGRLIVDAAINEAAEKIARAFARRSATGKSEP